MAIIPYCINTCYILYPNKYLEYIDNNAIVEVPITGFYYLYIYFSNANPLIYEIN